MKNKNKKLEMYTLELNLNLTPELFEKWCQLKGFSEFKEQFNASSNSIEKIDNTETKMEFFERLMRQELLNIAVYPIQNAMIQEANQQAQKQVEELKLMADNALKISLTKN